MKTIALSLALLSFAGSAFAIEKAELEHRIHLLTSKFEALQQKNAIPAENLGRAKGIVLLDRTKAGFLFAYQGGAGVAMVKDQSDKWSPAAFLSANEASLGLQIGGQQAFIVILLMNTNATRLLTEPSFEFGGEARGTAADSSAGVEGKISSSEQPVLVYDERKGLYGGVAIKGGAIAPNDEANRVYYEQAVTIKDILFEKKVQPTAAVSALGAKLTDYSRKPTK
jgi:lipid-binding SYLF domain-containing protein